MQPTTANKQREEALCKFFGTQCRDPRRGVSEETKQRMRAMGYNLGGRPKGSGKPQKHGTVNSYVYYKCRCTFCKQAQRQRIQQYRATKKAEQEQHNHAARERADMFAKLAPITDTNAFND